MKKQIRILSALLCLVMVAAVFVPSFSMPAMAAKENIVRGDADPGEWCTCGKDYIDSNEDYTPVDYYHTYTVTAEPTLTQAGELTGKCSRCENTVTIVLPALNDTDYAVEETAPAACVEPGKAVYTWNETAYGEYAFEAETPCLGHRYEDGVCVRCGDVEDDFSDWCSCLPDDSREDLVMTEFQSFEVIVAPTLTSTGMLKGTCSRCHGVTWVELPVLSDVDYDIETVAEPTIETPGTDRYTWKDKTFGEFSFDVETEYAGEPLGIPEITLSNVEKTGKVKVAWTAVEGATEYEIYRCETKGGEYVWAKTTENLSYTNTGAKAGERWYYKVRALNGEQTGEFCAPKSRTTDLPRPVVTKVEHLPISGCTKLYWDKVEGAKEYKVYRAESEDGEYSLRLTTTNEHYTNTNVEFGKVYYYKVKAIHENSAANSAYSEVVKAICTLARPVVTTGHVASTGKNKLTWDAVEGAVKYEVYRSEDKEDGYKLLKTTESCSFINTTAKAGVTYYYKVKAIAADPDANSEFSLIKTLTCDLAQPKVTGSVNAKGKPTLTWEAVEGAIKYTVYRAESADGEYKAMKTSEALTYTNTSAEAGKTYWYKVKAVAEKSAANSAESAAVKLTAK